MRSIALLKQKHYKKTGFTIVELLIVIVVIAILAAISITAYNGVQNRANDNAIRTDAVNIHRKLTLAKVDLGTYPQGAADLNNQASYKLTKGSYDLAQNNVYFITDTVNDTYAVGLRSKSTKGFIRTNTGLIEDVSISAAATANAIGVTWGAAGTYARQGYTASNGTWSPSWEWTN